MRPRRRSAPGLTWADLSLSEELCLLAGWAPEGQGGPHPAAWRECRWTSWRKFLDAYQAVRGDLHAHGSGHLLGHRPFAEQVAGFAARHGLDALARASYEDIRQFDQADADAADE